MTCLDRGSVDLHIDTKYAHLRLKRWNIEGAPTPMISHHFRPRASGVNRVFLAKRLVFAKSFTYITQGNTCYMASVILTPQMWLKGQLFSKGEGVPKKVCWVVVVMTLDHGLMGEGGGSLEITSDLLSNSTFFTLNFLKYLRDNLRTP